ncbi:MAG TPA: permease-like cell division protein FtsX [Acidimicrobiia bacterium]
MRDFWTNLIVAKERFVSKTQAPSLFRRIFRGDSSLTRKVTADALPTSFQVIVKASSDPTLMELELQRLPGVDALERPVQ